VLSKISTLFSLILNSNHIHNRRNEESLKFLTSALGHAETDEHRDMYLTCHIQPTLRVSSQARGWFSIRKIEIYKKHVVYINTEWCYMLL